jgi:hypothetical protein
MSTDSGFDSWLISFALAITVDQVAVLGGVCAAETFFNLWVWAFQALRLRRIRFFRLSSLALLDMFHLLKAVISWGKTLAPWF